MIQEEWEEDSVMMDSVDEFVQDDRVYHEGEDEEVRSQMSGTSGWQPAPPSEASASVIVTKNLWERQQIKPRGNWKASHGPKTDASGKRAALWEEDAAAIERKKSKNYIVGGLDCLAVVKRLKNCWVLADKTGIIGVAGGRLRKSQGSDTKKNRSRKVQGIVVGKPEEQIESKSVLEIAEQCKRVAIQLSYADKAFDKPEQWMETIIGRPWHPLQLTNDWIETWKDVEDVDKKEAQKRVESITTAFHKCLCVEQAFEKIDRAEYEIMAAYKKEGLGNESKSSRKEDTNQETGEKLVSEAAERVQSIWRGCRSRQKMQELLALELAEMEAALLNDPNPDTFRNRDHKELEKEARRRAALKFELNLHRERREEDASFDRRKGEEKSSIPMLIQLSSGLEVAKLSSLPCMGLVQSQLGPSFDLYINKLWRILSHLRAEITRTDPVYSIFDFENDLREYPSYSSDGRILRGDLESAIASYSPSLSKYETDLVITFWDSQMDGLISLEKISETIRGSLPDRRHLLANFLFDELFFSKSQTVKSVDGRLERLIEFYKQFAPGEVEEGKPLKVHRKYKDTEKMNKELFKKLYNKYAPWLNPPEHLWCEKALRREQERLCLVEIGEIVRMFEKYLASDRFVENATVRGSIERAVIALRGAVSATTSTTQASQMRRADWLNFIAELSAGIPEDSLFENILCSVSNMERNDWLHHAEKRARRDMKSKDTQIWLRKVGEAEKMKFEQLKSSLSAESYEHYIHSFNDAIRKVRGSFLSVCGTDRRMTHLLKMFESCSSFGDDRKLSRKDFRASLARFGIAINKKEMEVLEVHYDNSNSGYVSVDAFLLGLHDSERKKVENARAASEIQTSGDISKRQRRWLKALASTVVPESEKVWVQYIHKGEPGLNHERPYWFCRVTGERTWIKPKRFERHDKQNWEKEMKRRITWALSALSKFREKANAELNVQLEVLDASFGLVLPLLHGSFSTLPKTALAQPSACLLNTLVLDSNQLKEIPVSVLDLVSLKRLSLADNAIQSLPSFDRMYGNENILPNLVSLRLSRNKISQIPISLSRLASLEDLELDNNLLTTIPAECFAGLRLKNLNLASNRIKTIHWDDLGTSSLWTSLAWLSLRNNQLSQIPSMIGENLANLAFLDLGDNRLSSLPESFGSGLTHVATLHLGGNELQKIPTTISKMTNLVSISLQHNALTELPEEFCSLVNLCTLKLNNNRLKTLPCRTGDLRSLQTLFLQSNRLSELPLSFCHLSSLEECHLHQNELSVLPPSAPSTLRIWKLHNNRIKRLSDTLPHGLNLSYLDLAGNDIESLPHSFHSMPELSFLRLDENPLEPILAKIVATGKYTTPDERNYGMLLRKLIDSVRGHLDLPGRIDTALGMTVAEAIRESEQEAKERLQRAKDLMTRNKSSPSNKMRSKSNQEDTQDEDQGGSNDQVPSRKGRTIVQQALSTSLKRFSVAHGGDGTTISKRAFHHCMQVVGNLLTPVEVDKLTARIFCMLCDEPQEGDDEHHEKSGEEIIDFDPFVSSIHDALRVCLGGNSNQSAAEVLNSTARFRDVAIAVQRYYNTKAAVQKVKATKAAAELVIGKEKMKSRLNEREEEQVRRSVTGEDMAELRSLSEKNEKLESELADIKRKLEFSRERARVVRELEREDGFLDGDKFQVPGAYIAPQIVLDEHGQKSPRPFRPKSSHGRKSPRTTAMQVEKLNIRNALREKTREIQELTRILQHTDAVARYYNDDIADRWKKKEDKKRKKREQAAQAKAYKNLPEEERTALKIKREKELKVKTIFYNHARQVLGGHKKVLSKGDMIAAAGEFYREFGRGRLGLEPREWREKLLRTVDEAFTSGYRDQKTGRFVSFDKDDNGFLDLNEFHAFCRELERRIAAEIELEGEIDASVEEKASGDNSRNQFGGLNVISGTSAMPAGESADEFAAIHKQRPNSASSCTVYVDFISSSKKIVPIVLRGLHETIGTLKSRVAFSEAISKENQLILYQGKRLDDSVSLMQAGIKSGDTVKLVLYSRESNLS